MSDDTDIIAKKPLLKAVLDIALKRLETAIYLGITAGFMALYQHHAAHNEIWDETGQHFQDLVKQVQQLQIEVNQLEQNQ